MKSEGTVTLSVFGERRVRSRLSDRRVTVDDLLNEHGMEPNGRRLALNGHPARGDTVLTAGDELTLVPRVQGG